MDICLQHYTDVNNLTIINIIIIITIITIIIITNSGTGMSTSLWSRRFSEFS